MNPKTIIAASAILAVVIAVAAAYTVYWHWASERVLKKVEQWSERKDWSFETKGMRVEGFPFSIVLRASSPSLKQSYGTYSWVWQMPDLAVHAKPWSINRLDIDAHGVHRVSRSGSPILEFDASHAKARVERIAQQSWSLICKLSDTKLTVSGQEPLSVREARLKGILQNSQGDGAALELSLEVHEAGLPPTWHSVSGKMLRRFLAVATVDHVTPGAILSRERVSRWQRAGGATRIQALTVETDVMTIKGKGSFELDEQLQPQAELQAELLDVDNLLDRLVADGVMKPKAGLTGKLLLGALAGRKGAIRLPVAVRDLRVYLGPIRLFRFRPIPWDSVFGK